MKAYPAYKDSGVEWLGEIPAGWKKLRIKRLSKVKRGASPRPIDDPKYFNDDGEFGWVRIADVTASERYLEQTTQTLSELGASLSVKRYPGDFFVSIAGTVGKPIITKIKCCIHDGFVYFPDLKINPEFLYYIFFAGELYKGLGKWGTQLNLNTETIGDIYIGLPPKDEIDQIVAYLDHKTRLIDTYVAKKQQQIERLQAYRTALINQAVTKGLNPDAPMKDSGIEWLGEIPAHWEILPIKYVAAKDRDAMVDGPFGSSVNVAEDYGDYSIPVVRTVNITDRGFNENDLKFIKEEKFELLKRHSVKPDDILFSKVGTIGNVCLFPEHLKKGMLSTTGSCKISVDQNKIKTKYMLFTLRTMKEHWYLLASSNVQPFLNMTTIKNVQIPLPTLEEQVQIVGFIETETVKIDNLITTTQQQIDRLQAYRTALISDAVTGKIDVRTDNYRDYT